MQLLLNNTRYGEDPELRVDGDCVPLTIAAISNYQSFNMYAAHADGVIYPNCGTIQHLLGISSVNHHFLLRNYHKIQKQLSPRSYPVANVDDIAPLRPKVHEALKTPEAHVASSGQTGHKYTDNPMEVPRTGTSYDPLTLPDMIQKAWPELTKDGARVLTAQSMGETRKAKACWNYNLGNMKASEAQSKSHIHQYLSGTWKYWDASAVAAHMKTDKNARYATPEEIRKDVGTESGGRKVIIFVPPDKQCRFMAFATLSDGIVGWRDYLKRKTIPYPDFVNKLNKSDFAGIARILKEIGYYSQSESVIQRRWRVTNIIWMRH